MTEQAHIEGLILLSEQDKIKEGITNATIDLLNEGFDKRDIKDYLSNLVSETVFECPNN